ncbi:MAG TPA: hypothetical protein PKA82_07385 [Pyrinomonadaceae bacterium]|nr:hypothetical protein [Pyrinomonadaceae bacterium]
MWFLFHNPPIWLLGLLLMIPFSVLLSGRGTYLFVKRRYKRIERRVVIGFVTVTIIALVLQLFTLTSGNPVIALTFPFGIVAFLLTPFFPEDYNSLLPIVPITLGVFLNLSAILAVADLFLRFVKPHFQSTSE